MIDESDDVTTWRFRRVSALAVAGSALLHATALAALLPETLPRQERLSEQADRAHARAADGAVRGSRPVPAAEQAAQRLPSGGSAFAPAASRPARRRPRRRHCRRRPSRTSPVTLPSAEPPPVLLSRDFGTSAAPPGPQAAPWRRCCSGVDAPPLVSGRDFARTAPSALAKSVCPAEPPAGTAAAATRAAGNAQAGITAERGRSIGRRVAGRGLTGHANGRQLQRPPGTAGLPAADRRASCRRRASRRRRARSASAAWWSCG